MSNAILAACGDVHSQSSVFLLLSVFLFLECTVGFSVCIKSRRYLSSIATVAHFVSTYTHCMRIFFFLKRLHTHTYYDTNQAIASWLHEAAIKDLYVEVDYCHSYPFFLVLSRPI